MMELKITQIYYMRVVPEWYAKEVLSGEGTIEEQICEHEKERIEKDALYISNLKRGDTHVEVVPKEEGDDKPRVEVKVFVTNVDQWGELEKDESSVDEEPSYYDLPGQE